MYAQAVSAPLVRTADLVARISPTLDAAAGTTVGHAVRTCVLTMRLAEALGIGDRDRSALFYGSLLHEAGRMEPASGLGRQASFLHRIGARDDAAPDRARVHIGTRLIRQAGFAPEVGLAVTALRERWDGRGMPHGLAGETIPLFGRLVAVCHDLDAIAAMRGAQHAMETIHARSGSWYDPALADVLLALCSHGLLAEAGEPDRYRAIGDLEPDWLARLADPDESRRITVLLGGSPEPLRP